ncbi:hypothetical protein ABBQ32_006549 [Trebouxia sp. C0010 RCD-2024]
MLLRLVLSFTLIGFAAANTAFSCQGCLHVAKTLEADLLKLEQIQEPENASLIGKVMHRRRMSHPRSEPQIFHALDTICSKVDDSMQDSCTKLIKEHRESLENDIYAEGIEHVRRLLCSDFSKMCPMHTLYDSGEL